MAMLLNYKMAGVHAKWLNHILVLYSDTTSIRHFGRDNGLRIFDSLVKVSYSSTIECGWVRFCDRLVVRVMVLDRDCVKVRVRCQGQGEIGVRISVYCSLGQDGARE